MEKNLYIDASHPEETRIVLKSKYSIVVNSATSALHISCLALGLTKNDYLWTSSNRFVASANCALYCNAKIDLVDINLENYNIDISILEKKPLFSFLPSFSRIPFSTSISGCSFVKLFWFLSSLQK